MKLRNRIFVALVLSMVLFSGCSNNTIVKYQCQDGSLKDTFVECSKIEDLEVSFPELDCNSCPVKIEEKIKEVTKTINEKIYVCNDFREVKNKDNCIDFDKDGWYEIETFKTDTSKTTKLFNIPSNTWRFTWECDSTGGYEGTDFSIISLMFYEKGKDSNDIFAQTIASVLNSNCVDGETSYVYKGNKDMFLKIQGANFENLKVKIEAKK